MDMIEKITLKTSLMDPGGTQKVIRKGTSWTPPNIPKKILRELEASPQLFDVTYRQNAALADEIDDEIDDEDDDPDLELMTEEEEEAFVEEWIRKPRQASEKSLSFKDYVNMAIGQFARASEETLEKARSKWEKFYGDEECPV